MKSAFRKRNTHSALILTFLDAQFTNRHLQTKLMCWKVLINNKLHGWYIWAVWCYIDNGSTFLIWHLSFISSEQLGSLKLHNYIISISLSACSFFHYPTALCAYYPYIYKGFYMITWFIKSEDKITQPKGFVFFARTWWYRKYLP